MKYESSTHYVASGTSLVAKQLLVVLEIFLHGCIVNTSKIIPVLSPPQSITSISIETSRLSWEGMDN